MEGERNYGCLKQMKGQFFQLGFVFWGDSVILLYQIFKYHFTLSLTMCHWDIWKGSRYGRYLKGNIFRQVFGSCKPYFQLDDIYVKIQKKSRLFKNRNRNDIVNSGEREKRKDCFQRYTIFICNIRKQQYSG